MATAGIVDGHTGDEATDRHRVLGLLAARCDEGHDLGRALLRLRRVQGMHDLTPGMQPLPYRHIEIFERLDIEGAEDFIQRFLDQLMTFLPKCLLQDGFAEVEILLTLLRPHEAAYTRARLSRNNE